MTVTRDYLPSVMTSWALIGIAVGDDTCVAALHELAAMTGIGKPNMKRR